MKYHIIKLSIDTFHDATNALRKRVASIKFMANLVSRERKRDEKTEALRLWDIVLVLSKIEEKFDLVNWFGLDWLGQ